MTLPSALILGVLCGGVGGFVAGLLFVASVLEERT